MTPRDLTSTLNRNSDQTLTAQLVDRLREEAQQLPPGQKFHSDKALCRRYAISLPIVRSALRTLTEERRIVRIPSKGTFIAGRSVMTSPGKSSAPRRIGVLAPLRSASPHAEALRSIAQVLEAADCDLNLREFPGDHLELDRLESFLEQQLQDRDGLILVSPGMTEIHAHHGQLERFARQTVFVNTLFRHVPLSCVLADYETATYRLTRHVTDQGYQRIAWIGGPANRDVSAQRCRGFMNAMHDANLPIDPDLCLDPFGEMGYADGWNATRKLMQSSCPPEAILAINDLSATGVLASLTEMGLRVPDDIALCGFDDRDYARNQTPPLTSGQLPYEELGKRAASLLLRQLNRCVVPGTREFVECPLVFRESSQRPPAHAAHTTKR